MMDAHQDRLQTRVVMWSDDLMNKYPFVTREASLRAIEYGAARLQLSPDGFAALRKERSDEHKTLQAVQAHAIAFCRLITSIPSLANLRAETGELPAAAAEILEMDDRKHPMVVKAILTRGVDVEQWLAATEARPGNDSARSYVIDFLEEARLTELASESYVDSGWASRFFPRKVGSGQTRALGSHKWSSGG